MKGRIPGAKSFMLLCLFRITGDNMAKILIADDEQLIRRLVGDCLKRDGHTVVEAQDGAEALTLLKQNPDIALALLDIMMPEVDGWEVCRRIREFSGMPIILISARSQDFDQIMGFESGADDYVTKPFSVAVLMHRVDTLLKRGASAALKTANPDDVVIDGLIIKPSAHEIYLDGEPLELTLKEYKIILKLCSHPGRVYSRDQLLDEVWGIEFEGDTRTVDSHMARLRTKFGKWGTKHIKTIYGTGYKVDA